ncbi:piezo-type mechanosensitive ion channel component 2-like [Pituophis catenifer annectens]|uniref:piezo-type mechanosensitive ion channel component 2-like n=1 Tax=Pituophis catenifer annectens TaxID=94852 RepID=UPI00399170F8
MLQGSFQIAFYYLPPNDFFGEEVLSHFGIVRFSRLDAGNIIHLLAPDIGMFLFGLIVTLLCRKTVKLNNWESEPPSGDQDQFSSDEEEDMKETESEAETEDTEDTDIGCLFEKDHLRRSHSGFLLKFTLFLTGLESLCEDTLRTTGKVFIMLLLGSTGIILPSACSAVYFFTFLALCTWWSWNYPISPVLFNSLCVFLAIFSMGHIIVLYLYQLPYFQDLIPSEVIYVRVLGIMPFIKTNITAPWKLHIHPHLNWPVALNPFFLLALYYLSVRMLQQWALPDKGPKEEDIHFHSEDYVEIKMHSTLQVVSLSSEIPQQCLLLQCQNHSSCSMDGYLNQGHTVSLSEHTIYSETSPEVHEKCNMEKKSSTFLALSQFITNQSYVIALITMMVWSITYNSWLTFVLLIWSCIIWMVHDRQLYALRSLPFLVTYGNVLVILNFIVGLNLSQEELFPGVATSLLIDLDLKPYSIPCVHLGAKILYQLTFWLLLKQYVMQRQKQKEEGFLKEVIVHQTEMDTSQNLFVEIFGSILKKILIKYWIYFCSIMFFIVSFDGKVALYKILYVILFLFCVALYQFHYEGWRRVLKGFWLISVSYSMIVLIAIYTYQFEMVSAFFLKTLEISEERLKDLGLEQFSIRELFTKILLPCAFLLVCIVQLHYFHKDFLNITDLTNISVNPSSSSGSDKQMEILVCLLANKLAPEPLQQSFPDGLEKSENTTENVVKGNKWAEEVDKLAPCLLKIIAMSQDMQIFAWRFLELHILKIVSICTIWITLQEVCLMNYVFFIVWTFAIPYSKFRPYASRICTFWSCLMVICKMLYQLKFIKPWNYSSNCTQELYLNMTYHSINVDEFLEKSSLYMTPIDPALWIGGLMKCSDNIFLYLKNHLTIMILMALEATVYRHQYFYRTQNQLLPPVTGSLFNNIARENLDEGLLNCIKYFLNYSFYKFGLEICFMAAVNVIGQRMDLYALIHASWLTYLLSYRQRKAIAQVWPKYCFFLASIVAFQYLLCIGLPPALCQDYPWRSSHWLFPSNLIKWLYLPDFAERPNTNFLLYDFLLLLFASFQWQVFEDEDQPVVRLQAGDNSEINQDLGPAGLSEFSRVPNFIHCRSYLDLMKVLIFKYFFWIALCLICVTATARINIFCMGYFVACFYFMHFGQSLHLKPLRDILRPWDYVIAYTTLVITVKNLLAVGACAYLNKLQINYCWLIQTFAMYCTIPGYEIDPPNNEICELSKDEAGILWDAVCFIFLLIQRRVFMSHYYLYIVTDRQATDLLASRAAEMFELKLKKKVTSRMEENRKSMEIMKKQIDLIKPKFKNQSSCKVLETESDQKLEEEDPGDDTSKMEKENKKNWWHPWMTQNSVVRIRSYCLFDTDSEDEEEENEHSEKNKKEFFKKKTAWQLAYEAWMSNAKSALNNREQDEIRSQRNKKEEERKNEQLPGVERANVSLESSDENIEILASEEDLDKSESIVQRIINIIKLISILMSALKDDIIEALNSLIKDNLDIADALRIKKYILSQQMNKGNEVSADMVLQHYRFGNNQPVYGEYKAKVIETEESQGKVSESPPTGNTEPLSVQLRRSSETDKDVMETENIEGGNEKAALSQGFTLITSCAEPDVLSNSPSEIQESADSLFTRSPKANKPLDEISTMMTTSELVLNSILHDNELEQSDKFYQCLPFPLKLGIALYHVMVSTSEMLCYFVIIVNHMVSASILSLVLSILIFLWPMLSSPRPTKFFWMTAIIYTEIMIVIKCISQFGFFPWSSKIYCSISAEAPFALPNIIGIEKKDGYAQMDLVQLLALFLHRYILKCQGLWDSKILDPKQKDMTKKSKKKDCKGHSKEHQSSSEGWHLSRNIFKRANRDKPLKEAQKTCSFFRKPPSGKKRHSKETINQKILKTKIVLWIYRPIKQFFYDITYPESNPVCDIYAFIFTADVISFIIAIFGYGALGRHSDSDITESLLEDEVPVPWLMILLIQFGTMIIDRVLYLRKNMFGKCVFQMILVFGIHIWMCFILPQVTQRRFNRNRLAQLWYLVKCISFGLSTYQIKCGYPNRTMGHFLTKNYNNINLYFFQGFRIIPFLVELKAAVDWVWTDSTLSLSSWNSLENIYAKIFIIKCQRECEKKYPQPPGQKKKPIMKYRMGGITIFLLVFIVWFPLLLMSLKSVAGITNQPLDVSVKITISGYESLFTMSAQQQNLVPFTHAAYNQLTAQYALYPSASYFIDDYRPEDIVIAKIKGNASLLWSISPGNRKAIIAELSNSSAIYVNFHWTLTRNASIVMNIEASGVHTVRYGEKEIRDQIIHMLSGTRTEPIVLPGILPKYLRATYGADAKIANNLKVVHSQKLEDIDALAFFRNITIKLQHLPDKKSSSHVTEWWIVKEQTPLCLDNRCSKNMEIIICNDKVTPSGLGYITSYGILGLYMSFVMVIGKFIREYFSGLSHSIMFEELPNVDRILKLCTEIFLAREAGELELEEQLFAKLIFLYRSPETMIKWTRERKEK